MALVRELLGKTPKIGENTFLAETAVIIGDHHRRCRNGKRLQYLV